MIIIEQNIDEYKQFFDKIHVIWVLVEKALKTIRMNGYSVQKGRISYTLCHRLTNDSID